MKPLKFVTKTVLLGIFSVSLLEFGLKVCTLSQPSANVHPFFRSFVTEIKTKLPSNLYVKIPKAEFGRVRFPVFLNDMTPLIGYSEGGFDITLCVTNAVNRMGKTPFCPGVGFLGHILVFHSSNQSLMSRYLKVKTGVWETKRFTQGVTAKCWKSGQHLTKIFPYCMWQENGQVFGSAFW